MRATLNKIFTQGVKIFQRSPNDRLIASARDGDLQEVRRLLANEPVDVNAKDRYYGYTALHAATVGLYDNVELIRELIRHGANINAKSDKEVTPLMIATTQRKEKTVRELLSQKGIEANAKDNDGYTALSRAINGRNIEIARLITSHINPSGNIVAV